MGIDNITKTSYDGNFFTNSSITSNKNSEEYSFDFFPQKLTQNTLNTTPEKINKKQPKILVVDDFKNKKFDIDKNNIYDTSHGDLIVSILKSKIPSAQIYKVEVNNPKYIKEIQKVLKENKIDAVNLSIGASIDIQAIKDNTNIKDLNKYSIDKHKQEILDDLDSIGTKYPEEYKKLSEIPTIERNDSKEFIKMFSDKNIPLYVASGNDGERYCNEFILYKGTIAVGALDKNGKKAKYSANNTVIKKWSNGDATPVAIYNKNKEVIGYDITQDGKVDIKKEDIKNNGRKIGVLDRLINLFNNKDIFGTSFATPNAIATDINKEYE